MTPPHRTLRCARCGALPSWIATSEHDPLPLPLCSLCAAKNEPDPPPPSHAAPLPRVPAALAATGSTVPTRWAVAAVLFASAAPQAAIGLRARATRIPAAISAAISVLDGAELRRATPASSWTSRAASRAPTPQPIAVPIAIPTADRGSKPASAGFDERAFGERGIVVDAAFARALPASLGLRAGDVITNVTGSLIRADCTGGYRCDSSRESWVKIEGVRAGSAFAVSVACAAGLRHREVAHTVRAVLPATR